jgi:hypothetical protein
MMRKFVDFDGNVLEETEWRITPLHRCFYCDGHLILVRDTECPVGFLGTHDFVTICDEI